MPRQTEGTVGTSTSTRSPTTRPHDESSKASGNENDAFVIPIVHITLPETAVNVGFWGALVGAAALGTIELPMAALIGAGVVVARHHRSH